MRGEYVVGVVLTLGLLHRGTEKLMELRHPSTNGSQYWYTYGQHHVEEDAASSVSTRGG